jgi:hypothetical protein
MVCSLGSYGSSAGSSVSSYLARAASRVAALAAGAVRHSAAYFSHALSRSALEPALKRAGGAAARVDGALSEWALQAEHRVRALWLAAARTQRRGA